MTRRPLLAVLAVPVLLLLAACGPGTPPDDAPEPPPAEDPQGEDEPQGTPVALPDDALLLVQAVATAGNGATLDLSLVVREATAWDDPAAADRPALFTAGCEGAYDPTIYEEQLFSFAAIDVTATATAGTWPTSSEVDATNAVYLFPETEFLSLASTGDLVEEPVFDGSTPHCKRERVLVGAGTGTLVVGFRGDTDAVGAAGGFTRWANHNYGFGTGEGPIFLSDCSVLVTDLGAERGWDEATAPQYVNDVTCRFGVVEGQDADS
jgi:hypothetical protein